MTNPTQEFTNPYLKKDLSDLRVGDIVRVHQKIPVAVTSKKEKGKKESKNEGRRVQVFEGIIISIKHGKGVKATFCVRKIISNIGVEKTYPLHSPNIIKIEIISRSKVRRSKLYFLRERAGKKAKLKRKLYAPETPAEETEQTPGTPAEKSTEDLSEKVPQK